MANEKKGNLFKQLTRLFRSGPVVKRNIIKSKADTRTSSAFEQFRKNQSQVYSAAMSAYGAYDRMARYSDFSEMEYTPEIASALDIYSEESVAADENGKTLHIYSENSKIRQILTELFYDTLNVEFNMSPWIRNLVKYGDFFLFNDVHPEQGVINAYPLPISEIEREEGFDPNDPMAVRFRWVTQGNQILENWQVSHMRLLGNDAFLPYGSSVLEPARRIWRQLILLEDAMMVMRVVRAPDRRVFYIDVGNVPPEDIPNYMEQAQSSLKRSGVVDKSTGRVDLRYNPLSIDEDYFIPVRGSDSGTKIDQIGGQGITGDTNDVEYIQKKLFAALKIPKAYLGYDEGLGAKATLSQEDIRFSRTIARIQRTILSEMNKIAIVHLYCHGFTDEDLVDFTLKLSNPSTIAQQQKLELFKGRFEAAASALGTPGLIDRTWVQKNILRLNDEEIKSVKKGLLEDKLTDLEVESTQLVAPEGPESPPPPLDLNMGGGMPMPPDMGGGMEAMPPPDTPPPMPGLDLGSGPGLSEKSMLSIQDDDMPIKIQNKINASLNLINEDDKKNENEDDTLTEFEKWQKDQVKSKETSRKKKEKYTRKNHLFADNHFSEYQRNRRREKDVFYDVRHGLKSDAKFKSEKLDELSGDNINIDEYLDNKIIKNAELTNSIKSTLKRFDNNFGVSPKNKIIISETKNSSGEEGSNE
jgi:sulfur relay (sulfurtransferase) DsrC/TusE family protein